MGKYVHCVAVHMCVLFPYYVENMFGRLPFPEGQQRRQQICILLWTTTWTFGGLPLQLLVLFKYCRQCMHLSGLKEWVFVALGVLLLVSLISVMLVLHEALLRMAVYQDAGLAGLIVVEILLAFLATKAFDREKRQQVGKGGGGKWGKGDGGGANGEEPDEADQDLTDEWGIEMQAFVTANSRPVSEYSNR